MCAGTMKPCMGMIVQTSLSECRTCRGGANILEDNLGLIDLKDEFAGKSVSHSVVKATSLLVHCSIGCGHETTPGL
jgi:hypothetical protein